ncbi:MAG: Clp protease N-terminal domain-containing protein [Cumulibacter sp.]
MADHPGSVAAQALAQRGLSRDSIERAILDLAAPKDGLDADALSDLGIDLDAVRERVEAHFGPGALERGHRKAHLPFSKAAKKSLELALREAIRLGEKAINDRHLLLGVLREGVGSGYRIVIDAGVDIAALRAELDAGGTARTA